MRSYGLIRTPDDLLPTKRAA